MAIESVPMLMRTMVQTGTKNDEMKRRLAFIQQ